MKQRKWNALLVAVLATLAFGSVVQQANAERVPPGDPAANPATNPPVKPTPANPAAQGIVCGPDPAQNTKVLQEAINRAKPIDTLLLPPGVCVLAKCEVADPKALCKGASGEQHSSALYIGNSSRTSEILNLELVGDPSGTSVLKLDPNPPRPPQALHPYCSDTHLVSVEKISHVTFRGFTIDGSTFKERSPNTLPNTRECPKTTDTGEIEFHGFEQHMHGLYIKNASDVEIVNMRITNANGDGLNLIASKKPEVFPLQPSTEVITVRDSEFSGNKRSGISFQRNVSDVSITNNTFQHSGTDQVHMETSGGDENEGPKRIDITNNRFETADGDQARGIAVALGAGGNTTQGLDIRFTDNYIGPAANAKTFYGGCIFVDRAKQVTIKDNTVFGGVGCYPVQAQRVQGLIIEGNELHGYRNSAQAGRFRPSGVISIAVDTAKINKKCLSACEFKIHYADDITILSNRIVQHVPSSSGIDLEGVDGVSISDNQIILEPTPGITPVGTVPVPDDSRAAGVAVFIGVHPPPEGAFYGDERKLFKAAWIDTNAFINFNNAVLIQKYSDTKINSVALTRNSLSSTVPSSRGLYLKSESSFVTNLRVDRNLFGCGFVQTPPKFASNAFVHPLDQAYQGDIGSAIPGNPTPCLNLLKPGRH